jgi:hypothetical protein
MQSRVPPLRPHYRPTASCASGNWSVQCTSRRVMALPGGQLGLPCSRPAPTAGTGTQIVGDAGLRLIVGFAPPLDAVGLHCHSISLSHKQSMEGRWLVAD